QQPVVAAGCRVVLDLRLDRRDVVGRFLRDHLAPLRFLWMEPLPPGEPLVHLLHDRLAVADQRHVGRPVVADFLGRDVELDDLDVLCVARRQAEMQDPVEPRAIRNTTSAFCNAKVRAAETASGCSSGITPLPIGERRNGICVRSIKLRTSSSACDHPMPLPTMTSGRSARSSMLSAASTFSGGAWKRGGSGTVKLSTTSLSSHLPVMMSSGMSR